MQPLPASGGRVVADDVDGDLGDWPKGIERHPVRKILTDGAPDYGVPEGVDLTDNPDLSAAFSVGYDPEEQLLYLAVTVLDDKVVVGHKSHLDTDAVEVYIDGLRSDRRIAHPLGTWWKSIDLADVPVLRRVGLPVSVANGVPEARERAAYVTARSGGHGAVREVVEVLLKARGEWEDTLDRYYRERGDVTD